MEELEYWIKEHFRRVRQAKGTVPIGVPWRPFLWIRVPFGSPFLSPGPLFHHFRLKNAKSLSFVNNLTYLTNSCYLVLC